MTDRWPAGRGQAIVANAVDARGAIFFGMHLLER